MFAKLSSATITGIEGVIVKVEVDMSRGLPNLVVVGLPDTAVKESRDRVRAALLNAQYDFPAKNITVNLSPADIRKQGALFDLPIALGILMASEQIAPRIPPPWAAIGELALEGIIRPVKGALSVALACKAQGIHTLFVPAQNQHEATLVPDIKVIGVRDLAQAAGYLSNEIPCTQTHADNLHSLHQGVLPAYKVDFSEVRGQESAKRAMAVAAGGRHHLLMVGPPGSGKTMLAKRLPSILPRLTLEEALDTTRIHSVSGHMDGQEGIQWLRPFRHPHHTVSYAGLVGGGSNPQPGEISLAHHGVLFLDELPEFSRKTLEVLRQPLEEGQVVISRANGTIRYPSRFMLVCAMNPCPCGFYTDTSKVCRCSPRSIQQYMGRISGPLMDRIDIQIEVPAISHDELSGWTANGTSSASMRELVDRAAHMQNKRFQGSGISCNSEMGESDIRKYCILDAGSQALLKQAIETLGLSARAYTRILKVSRTLADMEEEDNIQTHHVTEAVQYRTLDRNFWA